MKPSAVRAQTDGGQSGAFRWTVVYVQSRHRGRNSPRLIVIYLNMRLLFLLLYFGAVHVKALS